MSCWFFSTLLILVMTLPCWAASKKNLGACKKYQLKPKSQLSHLTELVSQCEDESTEEVKTNTSKNFAFCQDYRNPPRASGSKGVGCDLCLVSDGNSASRCIADWKKLSLEERGNRPLKGYSELVKAHGLSYNPRTLTCKAYKESTFDPSAKNRGSSAFGLGQVLKSSAVDLFKRDPWFQSRIPGFSDIRRGDVYHQKMKTSILAQMELGLAIFHQKARDYKTSREATLLKRYRGSCNAVNNHYQEKILQGSRCLAQIKGNKVDMSCLKIVKAGEPKCRRKKS